MSDIQDFLKEKLKDKFNQNGLVLSEKEREENLHKWLGNSQMRDVVYHASMSDIEEFDLTKSTHVNYIGRGIYTSSSIKDVNVNYAHVKGPDLVNRLSDIQERAEMHVSYYEGDSQDENGYIYKMLNSDNFSITKEEYLKLDEEEQLSFITKEMILKELGNAEDNFSPVVYPVYIKAEKPFDADELFYFEDIDGINVFSQEILDTPKVKAYLEKNDIDEEEIRDLITDVTNNYLSEMYMMDDVMVMDSNFNLSSFQEIEDFGDEELTELLGDACTDFINRHNGEYIANPPPAGIYTDVFNAIQDITYKAGIDLEDVYSEIKEELYKNIDGLNYESFKQIFNDTYFIDHISGYENELHGASHRANFPDLMRQALQTLGYDSFVMDAGIAFPGMKEVYPGEAMHYIVFDKNQIKSAIGNNGLYDKNDPRIAYKLENFKIEQNAFNINYLSGAAENIANQFIQKFPVIKDKINLFKTEKDLPHKIKKEFDKSNGMSSAFFDEDTKETSIFLFNIKDEKHLEKVMAHEIIGHLGVKTVLGNQYNRYLESAYNYYDKNGLIDDLKVKYSEVYKTKNSDEFRRSVAEEKIAETVENYGIHKIPFYKTIVGKVKSVIRESFPLLNLEVTQNDVNYLISNSYKKLQEKENVKKTNFVKKIFKI